MSQPSVGAGGLMSKVADHRLVNGDTQDERIAAIYEAVGQALGLDPGAEPIPIREAIDPEALAHVFNEESGSSYVSFPVSGSRVTVHSDGEVLVYEEL